MPEKRRKGRGSGLTDYCYSPKNGRVWFYSAVMPHKNADGMANSVGPVQTAPLGAV